MSIYYCRSEMASDKSAIVIDNGSAFCKVGFAGDDAPRHSVPAVVRQKTFIGAELTADTSSYVMRRGKIEILK